jgi:hypothetical protein
MTDAEIDFMAERLKPLLMVDISWLVETDTEPVGFLLALPDYNVAFKPMRGRLLSPGLVSRGSCRAAVHLGQLQAAIRARVCPDLLLSCDTNPRIHGGCFGV